MPERLVSLAPQLALQAVMAGCGGALLAASVLVALFMSGPGGLYHRHGRAINALALIACASARVALLVLEGHGAAEHAAFHHFMVSCRHGCMSLDGGLFDGRLTTRCCPWKEAMRLRQAGFSQAASIQFRTVALSLPGLASGFCPCP